MHCTKLRFDDSTDVFTSALHLPVTVTEEPGWPGNSLVFFRSMWTNCRDDFTPTFALGFFWLETSVYADKEASLADRIASTCHLEQCPK